MWREEYELLEAVQGQLAVYPLTAPLLGNNHADFRGRGCPVCLPTKNTKTLTGWCGSLNLIVGLATTLLFLSQDMLPFTSQDLASIHFLQLSWNALSAYPYTTIQDLIWLNSVFWLQFLFGASDWVLQSGVSRVLDGDMLCQFLELTSMQQESVLTEPQGIASVGFSAATSLSSLSSSSSSSLSASGRSLPVDRVLRLLERIHNSLAWNVERKENHSTSSLHHAIWKLSETEIITKLPLILALSFQETRFVYCSRQQPFVYL